MLGDGSQRLLWLGGGEKHQRREQGARDGIGQFQACCAPGCRFSTTKAASDEMPLSARFSLSSARGVAVHASRRIFTVT